ncbi:MAG: hypothetical protein IT331_09155 [Anaerolineae bacterium]|nr:hypothetical protein [Anaerolineae bacterium]
MITTLAVIMNYFEACDWCHIGAKVYCAGDSGSSPDASTWNRQGELRATTLSHSRKSAMLLRFDVRRSTNTGWFRAVFRA